LEETDLAGKVAGEKIYTRGKRDPSWRLRSESASSVLPIWLVSKAYRPLQNLPTGHASFAFCSCRVTMYLLVQLSPCELCICRTSDVFCSTQQHRKPHNDFVEEDSLRNMNVARKLNPRGCRLPRRRVRHGAMAGL
jgi:hypothetical protein